MNIIKIVFLVLILIMARILIIKDMYKLKEKTIICVANIKENNGINGQILFYQKNMDKVLIDININGLPKNAKLGIHIHEAGDLSDGCKSACAHFNPFGSVHGGPKSKNRHVGDLGNIITDKNGKCKMKLIDRMIKLDNSKSSIVGRAVVIHNNEDDLGKGNNLESLKTGNAGSRIVCSVIGYSNKMFKKC